MELQMVDRQQELQLLDSVLAGDRSASRSFFNRYNCTIEMCVRKVLRGTNRPATEDEIRDLVSEVWVSLFEDDKRPLRRFDPQRDVRVSTWIGLLARNKTIDRLRCSRQRTLSIDATDEASEPPAETPLPCEQLEDRECRAIAASALAELTPEDRAFMEAWYVDAREPEDLAREFGISVGTVYSRRFKIQEKLTRAINRRCKPRGGCGIRRTVH